jgi:hypothetical protein
VRILKEVNHPNIVKLIEVFYHHQNLYLAMECLVCDLAKLIDDPKVIMTEADIAIIFKQILQGVEHLHKQWVLHRVRAAHHRTSSRRTCSSTEMATASSLTSVWPATTVSRTSR